MSGTLFIVSAASGTGKTSLVDALVQTTPQVQVSISHTTRPMRPGERDGENYHFISTDIFQQMRQAGEFLEHAQVFDNYYGTSKTWVDNTLSSGTDVILEIDWQGAAQIRELQPDAISIFIMPPCLDTLENRLKSRRQDSAQVIAKRLKEAKLEISQYGKFDYLVINDQFEQAKQELQSILLANRLRTVKADVQHQELIQSLLNP